MSAVPTHSPLQSAMVNALVQHCRGFDGSHFLLGLFLGLGCLSREQIVDFATSHGADVDHDLFRGKTC